MPENSSLKPSDVDTIAKTTREVANLAVVTVNLINSDEIELAKATAALCKEGQDLLREVMAPMTPQERQTVAKEIRDISFPSVQ